MRLVLQMCLLPSLVCGPFIGCQVTPGIPQTVAQNSVQQIVSMWQLSQRKYESVQRQTGFVGQLLFLAADNPVPQPVSNNVTLLIYEQDKDDWVLRRKHKFTPEAWGSHERTTAIGTVYNVFIPLEIKASAGQLHAVRVQYLDDVGHETLSDLVVLQ